RGECGETCPEGWPCPQRLRCWTLDSKYFSYPVLLCPRPEWPHKSIGTRRGQRQRKRLETGAAACLFIGWIAGLAMFSRLTKAQSPGPSQNGANSHTMPARKQQPLSLPFKKR